MVACTADDTHPQSAGNFGDQRIDAAVVGEIVQGLQGEDQVRFLLVFAEILINRRRSHALGKKLLRPLNQELHLATGGECVHQIYTALRVGCLIVLLGKSRGVVAAGKGTGDGKAEDGVCLAKGRKPVGDTGAGCGGFALVGFQI